MDLIVQFEKYKNKVVNIIIIIITLSVANNIYKNFSSKIEALKTKISDEEKKTSELEKSSQVEKKINSYKVLLVHREANLVISDISGIAKEAKVKVLSIRPGIKESTPDYTKYIYDVSINAPDYDALAEFVNSLENYKSIYMIENITIGGSSELGKKELAASLSVSSVAAAVSDQEKK